MLRIVSLRAVFLGVYLKTETTDERMFQNISKSDVRVGGMCNALGGTWRDHLNFPRIVLFFTVQFREKMQAQAYTGRVNL